MDPQGSDGALTIHADARMFSGVLDAGASVEYEAPQKRHTWIQVARGSVDVDGTTLGPGDGASTSDAGRLTITAKQDAELLVFDLG